MDMRIVNKLNSMTGKRPLMFIHSTLRETTLQLVRWARWRERRWKITQGTNIKREKLIARFSNNRMWMDLD